MKQIALFILSCVGLSFGAYAGEGISATELIDADKHDWLILDVRTSKEFIDAHVPGAINISHTQIEEKLSLINDFKDKPVIVYCRSGIRAKKAIAVLNTAGFKHVKTLNGHMLAWIKQEHDVIKGR